MHDLRQYLFALWREWQVLLTGGSITALLGLWERLWKEPLPWSYYSVIIGFFLLFASFQAWRKEHVENRKGPQILMEWNSSDRQQDTIQLRNIGNSSALNIRVGGFSWKELVWDRPIEIPSIHPNNDISQDAQFSRTTSLGSGEIGYMHYILESSSLQRDPLSLEITFEDVNNTTFARTFRLRLGNSVSSRVVVDLGPLAVKRS